jgi:hypothetical protein
MPRKAPDTVQEHRITFGTLERNLLEDARNVAVARTATNTVVGLAAGVGAGGLLLAAASLAAWKAPGIVKGALGDAWAFTEDLLGVQVGRDETGRLQVSQGVGGLGGVGGVLDDVANASTGGVVALRREGQALARERGEIAREISAYCSLSADTADAIKCNAAHDRKDRYFAALADFRQRVAAYVEEQRRTGGLFRAQDIYGGGTSGLGTLGDIDPSYQ